MVQTEGLALLPTEAARLLELSYYELDEKIKRQSSTTIVSHRDIGGRYTVIRCQDTLCDVMCNPDCDNKL